MKVIELTQNMVALIDDEDFERISGHSWHVRKVRGKLYAGTGLYCGKVNGKYKTKTVHMHRFILGLTDDSLEVDHINGDTLDNRRENLRVATASQNRRNLHGLKKNNTSGFRGVIKRNDTGLWRARIAGPKGNKINLGQFGTPEEAAMAFDKAAMEIYGEFAGKLNFPTLKESK